MNLMMNRLKTNLVISTMIASVAFGNDYYVVKSGDILSRVVKKQFPEKPIYGPKGQLQEILSKNPQIKNPDKIFPNQVIYLTEKKSFLVVEKSALENDSKKQTTSKSDFEQNHFLGVSQKWNLSALYGVKYLSISQSGALGKASVGALLINDFKFNSELVLNDWSAWLQFDSYRFKYETLTSSSEKAMHAFDLGGSYQSFIAGIGFEQLPLFRNNAGSVEFTNMNAANLTLGLKKDIELSSEKPTALKLKGWVRYPFSSSSDNAQVDLSSVSGFSVRGQLELTRQFFANKDYSLHATWLNNLGYQKVSQNVTWDTSVGKVDSTFLTADTALGLLIKF